MSVVGEGKRVGVPDLRARKGGPPIVSLTAYTTPMARLLDPHCDMLLVGDSLGMVVYGLPSTLPVTLDMMIAHGAAVVRGSSHACILVDLPFGSYQESPEQAFRAAARILQETGAAAVKLEGGVAMASTVRFLVDRGVPVCGHIGLMPQSVNVAGGFRATGRTDEDAARVTADATAIADAGAFALVVEGTVEPVAAAITRAINIPTIGIGASPECDGQILVSDDLLGLFSDFTPRFVRRYVELGTLITAAAASYAADVTARTFPGPEHVFKARGSAPEPRQGQSPLEPAT
jgi:3-methyl-2-oxobutanoate hydroxymethyltransferase